MVGAGALVALALDSVPKGAVHKRVGPSAAAGKGPQAGAAAMAAVRETGAAEGVAAAVARALSVPSAGTR